MSLKTFKVSKVQLDGSRSTLDHLGHFELDQWMHQAYGKFATIEVTEEATRKSVVYTDNGTNWEKRK